MSDLKARVWLHSNPTTPKRVLLGATIAFTSILDEAAVLTATVPLALADDLPTPFYASVELRAAGGDWYSPRNDLFTFRERTVNEKDPARFADFTGRLYVADRLEGNLIGPTIATEGSVTWNAASAGGVIADIMTRVPGHGVARNFTPAVDSAGVSWPSADIDDKTAQVYSSTASIMAALTKGGYCTWYGQGTELRLLVPGNGATRKTLLTEGAESVSVTESVADTASIFFVVTDTDVPVQTVTRAELGAGPRAAVVTVAGATTPDIALKMATPLIDAASRVRRQVTITFDAGKLPARPFLDFQLGDDFDVQGRTLRLVSVQITSGENTKVQLTFGEIFYTLAAKLAGRTASLTLGTGGTTIGRPLPATGSAPAGKTGAPNVPQLRSHLSMVFVRWDGMLTTGKPGASFETVVVEAAAAAGGPWFRVGQDFTRGEAVFPAEQVGVQLDQNVYVRLRSVNTKGVLSDPSGVAVVKVAGIALPDVAGDITDAIQNALNAAIKAGVTADGKNRIVVSLLTPVAPEGVPFRQGDLWYVLDPTDQSRFMAVRVFNGSVWNPYKIVADGLLIPGSVGGTLIEDGSVTSTKVNAVEIWANNAWLNQAVVTLLTAGRIQTYMLNVAAQLPSGSPVNRFPYRMGEGIADTAGIAVAIANGSAATHGNEGNRVEANPNGIHLRVPAGATRAISGITPWLPVPVGRKIYWKSSHWIAAAGGKVVLQLATRDKFGNLITWNDGGDLVSNGEGIVQLSDTAAEYGVLVMMIPPAPGVATDAQIIGLNIFEVVGNGQGVEISPGGLRFFNDDGDQVISLGTWGNDLLSISKKNDLGEDITVAAIDENGDSSFQNVDVSYDATFQGAQLVGSFAASQTNGVDLTDVPMFDRLGRGVIAVGDVGADAWEQVTHRRAALASFTVELRAGRKYRAEFIGNLVSEWTAAGGGDQLSMEIHWSTNTQSISNPQTAGGGWSHARILNAGAETGVDMTYPYIPFGEFHVGADGEYNFLVSLYNPAARQYSLYPGAWSQNRPRIAIVDLMPREAYSFDDFISRAYVPSAGGSSGSTTPVAPKTVTRTWSATWSVLWGPSGSVRPAGGSMYDDGRMLQGGNRSLGSGRAGRVGFPALGISGKTIKGAWLRVKVRHTGQSTGSTLRIGTHGNTSEPGGSSPNSANTFSKKVVKGQDLWIPIPQSLWPAIASGAIRGFQFGGPDVNTGKDDYVILDGHPGSNAASSNAVRPQMKITYQ
ncbi:MULTISPECIES: hypothetical protein [unclassified Microbacterium]|uniref:hypothetical protein n=1 Tax=unclassified Microbacterium TaxID=2609290 RepID=UPI003865C6F9